MAEYALRNLRTAYGETLVSLMERDDRIVVLDADLCRSTMTVLVEQRFSARFFEVGIAEQNIMATASGLGLEGKIPFANSFAVIAFGRLAAQFQGLCAAFVCPSNSWASTTALGPPVRVTPN